MVSKKRGLVIVLLALFIALFTVSFASAAGCLLYAQNQNLFCKDYDSVQELCQNTPGCSESNSVLQECSMLEECQPITCGTTTGCELLPQGYCQTQGWEVVQDPETSCTPGCCKITLPADQEFCEFGLDNYQCQQAAINNLGPNFDPVQKQFLPYTQERCYTEICGMTVSTAQLTITVKDENNALLSDVQVKVLTTTQSTTAGGTIMFDQLKAGLYTVMISKIGYVSQTMTVSLDPGASISKEIMLSSAGRGQINLDVNEPGTTLIWLGPVQGQTTLAADTYAIPDLPAGLYLIKISKLGFNPSEKQVSLSKDESKSVSIVLTPASLYTLQGSVYLENNLIPGVRIFLDGNFVGKSQLEGNYALVTQISPGEHLLSATHEGVYEAKEMITVPETLAAPLTQDLHLSKVLGVCNTPEAQLAPQNFIVTPIPGEKTVQLSWTKPCPEVIGYRLTKSLDGAEPIVQSAPSLIDTFLLDEEVQWGHTYMYELTALYFNPGAAPSEKPVSSNPVSPGDERCAHRYHSATGWETFCVVGIDSRKTVWSCDNNNILFPVENCLEQEFCAPLSTLQADCKEKGPCAQVGEPFGLYYTKDVCYGTPNLQPGEAATNFCYYDSTNTTADQCLSCEKVNSCYDYKSKDACGINSCLSSQCSWVPAASTATASPLVEYNYFFSLLGIPLEGPFAVTPETGAGFCTEEKYSQDDQCSLCGPSINVFENYLCTPDICTRLGRCFSNAPSAFGGLFSSCQSCGSAPTDGANCYTYISQLECTQGQDISVSNGVINPSLDRCDWGRCKWDGASCFKDGNADGNDDCLSFSSFRQKACFKDVTPPQTQIKVFNVPTLTLTQTELTFLASDQENSEPSQNNNLAALGYCLSSLDPTAPAYCDTFNLISYPGNTKKMELSVSVLSALTEAVNGQVYRLLFYSEDEYSNRESVQESFVFVDNVPPQFTVKEDIKTIEDKTTLTVWLDELNEPMSCTFNITELGKSQPLQILSTGLLDAKKVTFNELPGIVWAEVGVSCQDERGNIQVQKKKYTFDLEDRIDIMSPALYAFVASTTIAFEVHTTVEAQCELVKTSTGERIIDFSAYEEGKVHRTSPLPGFIPGDHIAEYKVVCHELAEVTQIFEDNFHFTVDLSAPSTKIILTEGLREVTPLGRLWEEVFVSGASVSFECQAEGFACKQTLYCLGEEPGCSAIPNDKYLVYDPASSLQINASTRICYYSTDEANNKVYSANCGRILIEGFGIVLENPSPYTYQSELWGISSTPVFDWQFYTKVPTSECRFDFQPGFTYEDVLAAQILLPNAENKYFLAGFPSSVFRNYPASGGVYIIYLLCKNLNGDLSPEQKIYLEYDPTAPQILEAYADPDIIYEGTRTHLFAVTDAKTICKYSDNSEGTGSLDFSTMEFSFPGLAERILDKTHEVIFAVNNFVSPDGKKEYVLSTQCSNGAGTISNVETISFIVDYASLGFIKSISPSSGIFLRSTEVPLSIETSKSATCTYYLNDTVTPLAGAGTALHAATLTGLKETSYQIPLKCTMSGGHVAESLLTFTVDFTAPVINEINDGNYSCGSSHLQILVSTNEKNISTYNYELFDRGNSSSSSSVVNSKVAEGSLSGPLPLQIPITNLSLNHKYLVKVSVMDAAGNWGLPKESDGIILVNENYSACTQDKTPPAITLIANETCSATLIEMKCADSTGCKNFSYGQSSSSALCNATTMYTGQKLTFERSSWLCYVVQDYANNSVEEKKNILLPDIDGDGVADTCDLCPKTTAGKAVSSEGCASGEIKDNETSVDTDQDGLPDSWERLHDDLNCQFSYDNKDSNNNGLSDAEEDYDQDTFSNYGEFLTLSDPCLANDIPDIPKNNPGEGSQEPVISAAQPNIMAWTFLIVGSLLVLGGVGYLIYYYRSAHVPRLGREEPYFRPSSTPSPKPVAKAPSAWQQKLVQLRKGRSIKFRSLLRENLFKEFTASSEKIPHVDKVLEKKGPVASKISEVVQKYAEHKEEIKPGLRPEEKSIFSKLDDLAEKSKKKDLKDLLSPKQAQDIFSKLQQISQKRKKK